MQDGEPWHDDGSDPGGDGPPIGGGGTTENDPVDVSIDCPTQVTRGDSASCTLVTEPANADILPIEWSFIGPDVPPNTATDQMEWGGVWAVGGRINVSYTQHGKTQSVRADVAVTERDWNWDASYKTFRHEMSSDLDFCISSVGLTADVVSCNQGVANTLFNPWQDDAGFEVKPGTGPNAGLWFLDNPSKRMDIRTGLHPNRRPDGPTYPVLGNSSVVTACLTANPPITSANMHIVNTTCIPTQGFTDLITHSWAHEGRHMAAIQSAGQDPANDFLSDWEGIVADSEADAEDQAEIAFLTGGGTAIWVAADTHNGAKVHFSYYYYMGSGVFSWQTLEYPW